MGGVGEGGLSLFLRPAEGVMTPGGGGQGGLLGLDLTTVRVGFKRPGVV